MIDCSFTLCNVIIYLIAISLAIYGAYNLKSARIDREYQFIEKNNIRLENSKLRIEIEILNEELKCLKR